MKPANTAEAEERYISNNYKGVPSDSVSNQSSMDEFYLLPEHKKGDADTKSFEYHEMSEMNSTVSTPASERKTDIVTSTKIEVPGAFFANPAAQEKGGNIDRLSNFGGSTDEILKKGNSNNNNSK